MKSKCRILGGTRKSEPNTQGKMPTTCTSTSSVVGPSASASPPLYSCKPDPDDILLQMFVSIGSRCLRCSKKAEPHNMVLCQCGNFVCLDCFLKSCFCDKRGGKEKTHEVDENKKGAKCLRAADYVRSKRTSTSVCLEGEQFQLECVFLDQPPSTS